MEAIHNMQTYRITFTLKTLYFPRQAIAQHDRRPRSVVLAAGERRRGQDVVQLRVSGHFIIEMAMCPAVVAAETREDIGPFYRRRREGREYDEMAISVLPTECQYLVKTKRWMD